MADADVIIRIDGDNTGLLNALQGAQTATAGFMSMVGSALLQAGAFMSQMGQRITQSTDMLVDSFLSYEQKMAQVQTLLVDGRRATDEFGESIARLATTIPVVGGELDALAGLYQTISAGITDTTEATKLLEVAMKAGVAGASDTLTAVDVLTTTLNAYGFSAEKAARVSDILFTTIRRGKTTFAELGTVFGRLPAMAAQVGLTLEEAAAAISTLTRAGIQTDIAVTSLRNTMIAFLKPTERMSQVVRELGFDSALTMIKTLGFAESLKRLTEAVGGNEAEMTKMFNNIRQLQAVMPLSSTLAQEWAKDIDIMLNSTGDANKAFQEMANTWGAQLQLMRNQIEMYQRKIGEDLVPAQLLFVETQAATLMLLEMIDDRLTGVVGGFVLFAGSISQTLGPMVQLAGTILSLIAMKKLLLATQMQTMISTAGLAASQQGATATSAGLAAALVPIQGILMAIFAALVFVVSMLKTSMVHMFGSKVATHAFELATTRAGLSVDKLTASLGLNSAAMVKNMGTTQANTMSMTKFTAASAATKGGLMGMLGPLLLIGAALAGIALIVKGVQHIRREQEAEQKSREEREKLITTARRKALFETGELERLDNVETWNMKQTFLKAELDERVNVINTQADKAFEAQVKLFQIETNHEKRLMALEKLREIEQDRLERANLFRMTEEKEKAQRRLENIEIARINTSNKKSKDSLDDLRTFIEEWTPFAPLIDRFHNFMKPVIRGFEEEMPEAMESLEVGWEKTLKAMEEAYKGFIKKWEKDIENTFKVFDFFTTKEEGEETGTGIAGFNLFKKVEEGYRAARDFSRKFGSGASPGPGAPEPGMGEARTRSGFVQNNNINVNVGGEMGEMQTRSLAQRIAREVNNETETILGVQT